MAGYALDTAFIGYGCYQLAMYKDNLLNEAIEKEQKKALDVQGKAKKPPYCVKGVGTIPKPEKGYFQIFGTLLQ